MKRSILITLLACAPAAWGGDDRADAAVGGAVGGAVGAVVGQEIGERKGAIIGSAVGAAVGTAIATDDGNGDHPNSAEGVHVEVGVGTAAAGPPGRHCPPGQAKKGRC